MQHIDRWLLLDNLDGNRIFGCGLWIGNNGNLRRRGRIGETSKRTEVGKYIITTAKDQKQYDHDGDAYQAHKVMGTFQLFTQEVVSFRQLFVLLAQDFAKHFGTVINHSDGHGRRLDRFNGGYLYRFGNSFYVFCLGIFLFRLTSRGCLLGLRGIFSHFLCLFHRLLGTFYHFVNLRSLRFCDGLWFFGLGIYL